MKKTLTIHRLHRAFLPLRRGEIINPITRTINIMNDTTTTTTTAAAGGATTRTTVTTGNDNAAAAAANDDDDNGDSLPTVTPEDVQQIHKDQALSAEIEKVGRIIHTEEK